MRHSRSLLTLLVALLLLTAGGRLSAQEGPSLSVDPATKTVGLADGAFEVRILVDDVTSPDGLGGYTLVMDYDPAVLHGLSATDSGYVESTDNAVICPASGIDNEIGRLAILCFTIPIFSEPGPQTSEPHVLARVTFEPVGEGTTTLDIGETTLMDPQGNGLVASTSDGQVTVAPASAGPPTKAPPSPDAGAGDVVPPTSGVGAAEASASVVERIVLGLAAAGVALLAAALWTRRQHGAVP